MALLLLVVGVIVVVAVVAIRGILQIVLPPEQLKVFRVLDLEAVVAPKGAGVLAVILVAAPATGRGVVGPEPLEVDLGEHDAPDLVFFGALGGVKVVPEEPARHLSLENVEIVQV